ncbi:sugar MFS transporter [Paraliomyxa miuraensis]|uniref:sugar MFS transporter n=1 Tax=Paraliomyxa miuraensis TaxID=376150 RepID=UPI0022589CAE|nr:sugar MFS transporter [Paraliomyxa miuraensis]MCX4246007.1 sugar MFS transporter [Paraliomyxa miuraensis]
MSSDPHDDHRSALALLALLFFMWGFVTVLGDILVPHLKGLFSLDAATAMLVQMSFFGAYFVVGMPAGWLVARVGYRGGIVVGLLVAATGALCFALSSWLTSYAAFLLALFVLAGGITVLQVAANPYVTLLGPPRTAASRLNLTQGINSLGTTLAPVVGSWLILEGQGAQGVRVPYLGIAAVLVVLALVFARVPLPNPPTEVRVAVNGSVWRHRRLRLGALAIFLYVGAEVGIGSMLVLFFGLPEVAGMAPADGGYLVSFYWGSAMVGRFVGAALQRRFSPRAVLATGSALAIVLVLLTVGLMGTIAVPTLLGVGLFNSIMFPTIFSLAVQGLGDETSRGSGVLVMAIVGGALIPVGMGALADAFGYRVALLATVVAYAYIGWFARSGGEEDA